MVQSYKIEEKIPERSKIIAKRGNTYIPLNIKNIAVFYSVDRLIFAVDFSGKKFTIDKCLAEIEETVNTRNFFRVNRSVIVNSDAIKEFKVIEYGKIIIHLASPEWMKSDIQVSQYTAPDFREWIGSI